MSSSSLPQTFSEVKNQKKPPRSEGDSRPDWIIAYGVEPGEYQAEFKGLQRRLMVDPACSERERVRACLSLHAFGNGQEVAVKAVGGVLVPFTRADIAAETGLSETSVRRALAALESAGYVTREEIVTGGGLARGNIQIRLYVAARPAAVNLAKEAETSAPELEIPDSLPAALVAWAKRRKRAAVLVGLDASEVERLIERAGALEKAEADLEAVFSEVQENHAQGGRAQTVRETRATPITAARMGSARDPLEVPSIKERAGARSARVEESFNNSVSSVLSSKDQREQAGRFSTTRATSKMPACLPNEPKNEPNKTALIGALIEREVNEASARALVKPMSEAAAELGLDRIDLCDFERARDTELRKAPIRNPAGFYFRAVKNEMPLPADWETRAARREREQAQRETERAIGETAVLELAEMEARERYDAFIAAQADVHLATLPEATVTRRLSGHMERIQVGAPQYHWTVATLRSFALKALRAEIASEFAFPTFEAWSQAENEAKAATV